MIKKSFEISLSFQKILLSLYSQSNDCRHIKDSVFAFFHLMNLDNSLALEKETTLSLWFVYIRVLLYQTTIGVGRFS